MDVAVLLAAYAQVDPRTAARAVREGPQVIRTRTVRQRIKHAADALGIELPESTPKAEVQP